MEILTHRDRRGKLWRFGLDCTAHQCALFRRELHKLCRLGVELHPLSIAGMTEDIENGDFFADVEAAILHGLADAFPPPPEFCTGAENMPPVPQDAGPLPRPVIPTPADDRPRFWWENL